MPPKRKQSHVSVRERTLLFTLAVASIILSLLMVTPPLTVSLSQDIHWHAYLKIMVNGAPIPIPAGIGLRSNFRAVQHTHDWDGIIHIEGQPTPKNLRLGTFFDIWGVRFDKNCLFQYCNQDMAMFVNGEKNQQMDDYLLQDGDSILLEVTTF